MESNLKIKNALRKLFYNSIYEHVDELWRKAELIPDITPMDSLAVEYGIKQIVEIMIQYVDLTN
jgi:hypothetical protein